MEDKLIKTASGIMIVGLAYGVASLALRGIQPPVPEEPTPEIPPEPTEPPEIPPAPPGPAPYKANLYGAVFDKNTGGAVSGALVSLNSYSAQSGATGGYTLLDVDPKTYMLSVSKAGYNTVSASVEITAGSNLVNIELVPEVAPPGPPQPKAEFCMPAQMDVEVTNGLILGMYYKCEFTCRITNKGDATGTHTITGQDSLGRGGSWQATLAPGQTYVWSVWYYIDFSRVSPPYAWELLGDWDDNNYLKGEARPDMAVIAPDIEIGSIVWDGGRVEFAPGSTYTGKVSMRNPTTRPWSYNAMLRMGTDQAIKAEAAFQLNSGESKEISFSVKMPSTVGSHPVYIDISSSGVLIKHHTSGTVKTTYSWSFSGGLSSVCTRYFQDGMCYEADIYYTIDGSAPNFRWELVYWDYHYTNTYQRGGNGPASGKVTCTGGALLFAHPNPNATLGIIWYEEGPVFSGGFVTL